MITTHGGGTSRKRMHAAKDYSGAEIMRTLRDEVLNRGIPVVDFTAAIELIMDENGKAAGAVLHEHGDRASCWSPRAKTVIIATGGAGTSALPGLPDLQPLRRDRRRTWCSATVSGAKLLYADTLQYHPDRRRISRSRSSARSSPKRFVPSAPSSSTWTARPSCIRWRPATLPQRPSSVSAPTAARASTTAQRHRAFGSIPR